MSAKRSKAATIEAKRSGVYCAPANLAALRKDAAQAALVWFELPLQAVSTKKQFLAACATQLQLPSHFGGNWDALADCVRDLSWVTGLGYVLHLSQSEKFSKAAAEDFQTALAVLAEAAIFWKQHGTPFVVFVDAARDLPAF